jgi:hypothetical protein
VLVAWRRGRGRQCAPASPCRPLRERLMSFVRAGCGLMRFLAGASGAKKLCALGAMGWCFCAAPQLDR